MHFIPVHESEGAIMPDDYDKVLAELQELIDDKPPPIYTVMPFSDLSKAKRKGIPLSSLYLPPFIPGSWEDETSFLTCRRHITNYRRDATRGTHWQELSCPVCDSNATCRVETLDSFVAYCTACHCSWRRYLAWCPTCGRDMWWEKEHNLLPGGKIYLPHIQLHCSACHESWDVEVVKSVNETNDIWIEL